MGDSVKGYFEIGALIVGLVCLVVAGLLFFPKVIGGLSLKGPEKFDMIAELKGSTYGEGDTVSVFGVCRDVSGRVLEDAMAYLSARYPNGSILFTDDLMTYAGNGVFLWTGSMYSVGGTYLTQIKCVYKGRSAYAYGEWQNPLWVRQIKQGMITANDTYIAVQNMNQDLYSMNQSVMDTLVAVNGTIVNEHGITREYIANQSNYTNQLVLYAADVANASVDRNNSLLYNMLYYLMLKAGYPITGNVTAVFISAVPERPVYKENWRITAGVIDEYNRTISYPDVECYMSSNLAPTFKMTPEGEHFIGDLFQNTLVDEVSIDVTCNRIVI